MTAEMKIPDLFISILSRDGETLYQVFRESCPLIIDGGWPPGTTSPAEALEVYLQNMEDFYFLFWGAKVYTVPTVPKIWDNERREWRIGEISP